MTPTSEHPVPPAEPAGDRSAAEPLRGAGSTALPLGIAFWREHVFRLIFLGAIVLGFVGYLLNSLIAYRSGDFLRIGLYTAAYAAIVGITVARRLPFTLRAWAGLAIFYLMGIFALHFFGPAGAGRMWLLWFALLTSLLFGLRAGIRAMAVNIATYLVLSGPMYTGRLDLPLQPPDPSLVWVTSGLAFMYLSTVATLTVGFFVDRLEQVMDNDRGLVDELRKANDKLAEENRERKQAQERLKRSDRRLRDLAEELEARVAGRTKALETANRQLQHEVAERRQAEGVIRSSQQSLRRLYHRLQQAREEERLRIAREVHDELGQNLTALRIDLAWLERRWAGDGAPVQEKLQSMARTVDESLLGIRRITTELRPGVLDALGLCPAVEWLLKDFGKRTGIDCTADIEPEDIDLDLGRRTAAFRILQEALTNVARHARATRVRVTLRQEGGRLQLKIVDNGIGISDELANSPAAIGICGIRERINEYGGDTRIQGRAGAGTEIAVSIPLG